MKSFCSYLKEIDVKCSTCREDGVGACQIKLGDQEYYRGFGLSDIISIVRHNQRLSIETDIEVKYETNFPYGIFAGKGPEFATEYADKEKAIKDFLGPKLPIGVRFLPSHQHYTPDKRNPEVVAMHIHVHKAVEDLDEAKHVASKLAEIVVPKELEALLTKK